MADIAFADYSRMLHKLAHKNLGKMMGVGMQVEYEDLFQELSMAFCRARDRWNPDQGAKFSTYLFRSCENHIKRMLAGHFAKDRTTKVLSLDTEVEMGLLNTLTDGIETAEDRLVRQGGMTEIAKGLGARAKAVFMVMAEHQDLLERIAEGVSARIALGQEMNIGERQPHQIDFALAAQAVGFSPREALALRDEIKRKLHSK